MGEAAGAEEEAGNTPALADYGYVALKRILPISFPVLPGGWSTALPPGLAPE